MSPDELIQRRREKWHVNGNAVRTLEEARGFIESVGFCLMFPIEAPVLLPTLIGAWSGSDDQLPTQKLAYKDPRTRVAAELTVRLLRDKSAYEVNLFDENNALVLAASVFPYF